MDAPRGAAREVGVEEGTLVRMKSRSAGKGALQSLLDLSAGAVAAQNAALPTGEMCRLAANPPTHLAQRVQHFKAELELEESRLARRMPVLRIQRP